MEIQHTATQKRNLDQCFDFSSHSVMLSPEPSCSYRNCLSHLTYLRGKHASLLDDFSCEHLYSLLLEIPSSSPHSSSFWAISQGRLTSGPRCGASPTLSLLKTRKLIYFG